MRFKYHMYGANMGKFQVMVDGVQVFLQSGNKGNKWLSGAVPIAAGIHEIVFSGTRGSSWKGDMALDDVRFESSARPPPGNPSPMPSPGASPSPMPAPGKPPRAPAGPPGPPGFGGPPGGRGPPGTAGQAREPRAKA